MNTKMIWLGMFVGSLIGGYIPELWGAGMFSLWGVVMSAVGSLIGIWLAFRLTRY